MDIGDNLKKLMGITPEKEQRMNDIMSGRNLPSGFTSEQKNQMISTGMDLNPIGGMIGAINKIKPEWNLNFNAQDLLKRFHNKMGDIYTAGHSPDEAFNLVMQNASPKEQSVLRALKKDDFLGFDYPHQALKAVLENPENFDISPVLKGQLQKFSSDTPKGTLNDFFGMHKSTDLGDVVLTRSAKDPSKYQMTLFDGKLGSSNTVKDIQFDTKEEAIKAFENQ